MEAMAEEMKVVCRGRLREEMEEEVEVKEDAVMT